MAWTSLCELSELKSGEGKYVEIDGFQLAVFIENGQTFVIDNTCPHAGSVGWYRYGIRSPRGTPVTNRRPL